MAIESYHLESIEQEWRVIRCLAKRTAPAGHTEIAEATGVRGAVLTRILATLKSEGIAEEPAERRYTLSAEFGALASGHLAGKLEALAAELQKTVENLKAIRRA